MKLVSKFTNASVGKKQLMAITGLIWTGFLVGHLSGNVLLLVGAEQFNRYAYFLHSLGLALYVAELFLLLTLFLHIYLALSITWENRKARKIRYKVVKRKGENNLAARSMLITGITMAFFLYWHLSEFKISDPEMIKYDGVEMGDLYTLVMNSFKELWFTLSYIFVMILVGIHLSHGFQSSFQSLGLNHPKYTPLIQNSSKLLGLFLAVGFTTIAIGAHLIAGGGL